ncbi:MAG TPA: glycoside hydrolase family 13 protein [Pseudonocardiaceae bacterium]|nr:glycoside hydrolase family 13 protein [Pseudonocardiaceae bacterium]
MSEQAPWWRDAVIYQVYVRSFADGNGDGVGDLIGVRAHLDHLAELGVDAVWLTPFYPSPMADGGYDVADYRDVDPLFGQLSDAEALIADAHGRGLRVIVDIVPNHTSSAHQWFAAALAAPPGSPERARYWFRDGKGDNGELPPNDWGSRFGGPAWTRITEADGTPGQWYLHNFAPEQPDLNWENPEVHAEFRDILRFWLDLGVDGFRIDVAQGLVKPDGLPDVRVGEPDPLRGNDSLSFMDQDGVHEVYREWRRVSDEYEGRIFVAEAWVHDPARLARYVRPDELHTAFNFNYLTTSWSAPEFRAVIEESLAAMARVGASCTWVLSNHDVVRHVTRYGGGAQGVRRARAAALLTLALPGSAYVYQGEELGLPQVTDLPESVLADPVWTRSGHTDRGRDGCRVPIPWSGTQDPYGFGPDGSKAWLPQPDSWAKLSVEAESGDEDSMLSLYRTALRLRRDNDELGRGSVSFVDMEESGRVLVVRLGDGHAVTVNCAAEVVSVAVPGLPGAPRLLLASASGVDWAAGTLTLPPDTAAWWALG